MGTGASARPPLAKLPVPAELALFLRKVVPEVIDPLMGPFQLGSIQRQLRTIEATNIRMLNLLFVTHPPSPDSKPEASVVKPVDKIVGWNHSLGIIFSDNRIGLSASEYRFDRQNEHINIFQLMVEKSIRRRTIVAPNGNPQSPRLNHLNRVIEGNHVVRRTGLLPVIC